MLDNMKPLIAIILVLALASAPLPTLAQSGVCDNRTDVQSFTKLINNHRAKHNASSLAFNDRLTDIALSRSLHLVYVERLGTLDANLLPNNYSWRELWIRLGGKTRLSCAQALNEMIERYSSEILEDYEHIGSKIYCSNGSCAIVILFGRRI